MIKSGIDQDALVTMFSEATAKQGEALRKAVSRGDAEGAAGRELTLANIRSVLKTVTEAASAGAAKSGLPMPDVEGLLGQAFAGMDAALLQDRRGQPQGAGAVRRPGRGRAGKADQGRAGQPGEDGGHVLRHRRQGGPGRRAAARRARGARCSRR